MNVYDIYSKILISKKIVAVYSNTLYGLIIYDYIINCTEAYYAGK